MPQATCGVQQGRGGLGEATLTLGGLGVRAGDTACWVRHVGAGDKEPLFLVVGCCLLGVVGCDSSLANGDEVCCTDTDGTAALPGRLATFVHC